MDEKVVGEGIGPAPGKRKSTGLLALHRDDRKNFPKRWLSLRIHPANAPGGPGERVLEPMGEDVDLCCKLGVYIHSAGSSDDCRAAFAVRFDLCTGLKHHLREAGSGTDSAVFPSDYKGTHLRTGLQHNAIV